MEHTDAWAEKVQLLIENDGLRRECSLHARSMAERYDVAEFGLRREQVYAHVLIKTKETL